MSLLKAEGLVKVYGRRRVVDGVSFEVQQGEIVGLLGPNGAGKTTSFRMTCGLVIPNGGRVLLDDKEITKWLMFKRSRDCLLYTSPSPRDGLLSRMPSSA